MLFVFFFFVIVTVVFSTSFFSSPNGNNTNSGLSYSDPLGSLESILSAGMIKSFEAASRPYTEGVTGLIERNPQGIIQAGDTLYLMDGFHGDTLMIDQYRFQDWFTIEAYPGETPTGGRLEIRSSTYIKVTGLTVSPEIAEPFTGSLQTDGTLLNIYGHSWGGVAHHIHLENNTAYSIWDSSGWGSYEWNDVVCNGLATTGNVHSAILKGNYIKNVAFGISVPADNIQVLNNVVENFAGDGMRGLGDNCLFEGNVVKNCYAVNANHDDGFQSWSLGPPDGSTVGTGTVYNMVLRGNIIINYETPYPLVGTLQGIGCFDGFFENWIVENNIVFTDHYHAITLSGARRCTIRYNTVVDRNATNRIRPWIRIGNHKNGQLSWGNTIGANIAPLFVMPNMDMPMYNTLINNLDLPANNEEYAKFLTGIDPFKVKYQFRVRNVATEFINLN